MGCRYAAPVMMEAGGGAIVNIASVHGISGMLGMSAYAASKAGIIGMTRVAALDLAPFSIRINAISPGAIYLPERLERNLEKVGEEDREELERLFAGRYWDAHRYVQPLEEVGTPEDVARCAVFLASEDAQFITGQNIVLDGGATLKIPYRGPGQPNRKIFEVVREMEEWVRAHGGE